MAGQALRVTQVIALLGEIGMQRGYQARLAERLGVSPATICRDMARLYRLWQQGHDATHPAIGSFRYVEPERDAAAGPEPSSPPPHPLNGHAALSLPTQQRSDPALQVPSWLPVPPHVRTGRLPHATPGAGVSRRVGRR
jgi:hypothetical protein